MSVCSICRFQIVDNSTTVCPNCGAPIEAKKDDEEYESSDNALSSDNATDYDPGYSSVPAPDEDSIQICNPGDMLYQDNAAPEPPRPAPQEEESDYASQPIGDSTAMPPEPEIEDELPPENTGALKKLSEEQINDIRSNLMNPADDVARPADAAQIIHGFDGYNKPDSDHQEDRETEDTRDSSENSSAQAGSLAAAAAPPAFLYDSGSADGKNQSPDDQSQSFETSPQVRRVAYFHKNFIQLTGPYMPATGEELNIGDHHYLLKPKKIKTQYTYAAFAVLLVLVLFLIGKQFISPTMPGQGTIIGMILDEQNNPYINGIEIRIPEIGKKVMTDAQGFFHFEDVQPGIYRLSYTLGDGTVINESISVVDGQITMLSVGGDDIEQYAAQDTKPAPARNTYAQTPSQPTQQKQSNTTAKQNDEPKQKPAEKQYANVKLNANVSDAKLMMSGEVLGSGNLTYRKLAPGKHKVMVSKDGYTPWKGTITLKENDTYALNVNLEKISQASTKQSQPKQKEPTYSANDFFESGRAMFTDGNAQAAVGDFTEAIRLDPSMADAYVGRAKANESLGNTGSAVDDYVRAGEIFTMQNRIEQGFKLFEQAQSLDDKSISAMLNLASYYANKKDRSEALRYYRNVLRQDDNNFTANYESGKIYYAMGKNRDADKRLRKAKEVNPGHPYVYHYLMLNYFARDDFTNVKEAYAEFKSNTSESDVEDFKSNMKYDAILRIVGEYERP
ncbi:MAG: PEGA domain-containing protein [Candidatus Zixiibacteriota bacterium]